MPRSRRGRLCRWASATGLQRQVTCCSVRAVTVASNRGGDSAGLAATNSAVDSHS